MNFTLRDIRYFLAIASAGRLAQAAQACNVAQPTLTKAIQRLESEFGLRLFERSARGTHLTAEGRRFVEVAQELSTRYAETLRVTGELRAQQTGMLRIGVTDATRTGPLPQALATLTRQRPVLRVVLRVGQSDRMAHAVRESELDVALVPTYEGASFGCDRLDLGSDPQCPVSGRFHPLAQRSRISAADLAPFSWILPAPEVAGYRSLRAALAKLGLPPPVTAIEIEYVSEPVLALVRSTNFLAMVPRSLLQSTDRNGLHQLHVPELQVERTVALLTRPGVVWSPLMVALKDTLLSQMTQRQPKRADR